MKAGTHSLRGPIIYSFLWNSLTFQITFNSPNPPIIRRFGYFETTNWNNKVGYENSVSLAL